MSTDGPSIPSHAVPFENDAAPPPSPGQVPAPTPAPAAPGWTWLGLLIGTLGLGTAALLWNKVNGMQELLAQQTTQAQAQSTEARTIAKEAQDQSLAANTRLTVLEARLAEVSLQRGQLEELVRNLSRSQDDTLALDLEAAMRLAVQQAQLTGSTEPLIASLRSASKRIEKSAQPRLAPVLQAMERDLELLRQTPTTDTASLLVRLDEVLRLMDDLPLQSGPPQPPEEHLPSRHVGSLGATDAAAPPAQAKGGSAPGPLQWIWWQARADQMWQGVRSQAGDVLRISHLSTPEAALLAPEQGLFLRENLKLQLLNARLALLARQHDAARANLAQAQAQIEKYFVAQSRRTYRAQVALTQLQEQLRSAQQPNLQDTFAALATATASNGN
ncbi:MAG: uroporphyrinogen-III C-methyltransferase [Comamonas sp.]|jgi:uroporphyrin-III C-methyltransferase|nr:uroporphyrinogen-III C-methyltransferase [Comamonas sp.]